MTRKFLTPIVLPADPAAAMEAATKQYVDSKAGGTVTEGTVIAGGHPIQTLFYDTDATAVVSQDPTIPRGLRMSGTIGAGYTLLSGGETIGGGSLLPYTEANRLYEIWISSFSHDPAGFTPGLFIYGPRVGGVQLWGSDLHLYLSAAYQGVSNSWWFHSGPTGANDIIVSLRTTSSMKLGANGLRVHLIDQGYSSAARSAA